MSKFSNAEIDFPAPHTYMHTFASLLHHVLKLGSTTEIVECRFCNCMAREDAICNITSNFQQSTSGVFAFFFLMSKCNHHIEVDS